MKIEQRENVTCRNFSSRLNHDKFEFLAITRPINFTISEVVETAIVNRVGCATSSLSYTSVSRIPDRIYEREEHRPLNAIGFPGVRPLSTFTSFEYAQGFGEPIQPPKDNKRRIDGHATINMGLFYSLSADLSYDKTDVSILSRRVNYIPVKV